VLSPLTSGIRELRPIAYDLEWYPKTFEVRIVGVYDERGYRWYRTVAEFLQHEMTFKNRGRTFFAHAGGYFDVQFVLEELNKTHRFSVKASFSGSSAVLVQARQDKHVWTFADSFFLMRDSLKKIGKAINIEKLDCPFDAPFDQLRHYNERDCQIVYEAILSLQEELNGLGGELRPTLASCALNLFRRSHLTLEIPTSGRLNEVLRNAYCASRVEVFRHYAPSGEYYDINSSFPFSMTKPQPGAFKGMRRTIPPGERAIYFAYATVTVPECDLPPLPFKLKGRIFFPTGTWVAWFTRTDLELLQLYGGRIDKIHKVLDFEPFTDLADYVKEIYALRKAETAKGKVNEDNRRMGMREQYPGADFRSYTYKLLLNSLYGKFGERSEKDMLLIRPDSTKCNHGGKHPDNSCMRMVSPGIWRRTDVKNVPHAHVAISAYVTSLSRALLYKHLAACSVRYYADTDSVVCGEGEKLPTSPELGDLKYEGAIREGRFICPKVYSFTAINETDDAGRPKVVVKSKGFRRLGPEEFEALRNYEPVTIERMAGIKEGLRDLEGDRPFGGRWSKVKSKRLHKNTITKRARDGADNTRPWSVDELREKLGE